MWSKLSLKGKLLSGFGLILVLMGGIVTAQFFFTKTAVESYQGLLKNETAIEKAAKEIEVRLLQCRRQEKDFLMTRDLERTAQFEKQLSSLVEAASKLGQLALNIDNEELAAIAKQVSSSSVAYGSSFKELVSLHTERGLDESSGIQGEFRSAVHKLEEAFKKLNSLECSVLLLQIRRGEKDYMLRDDLKYVARVEDYVGKLGGMLQKAHADQSSDIDPLIAGYAAGFKKLVATDQKIKATIEVLRSAAHQVEPAAAKAFAIAVELENLKSQATSQQAMLTTKIALAAGLATMLLAVVLGLGISRSISKPVNRIIAGLSEGAEQVSSAAGEVSSTSQSLAAGSSEQAASIQETSASLEEMSSMTKQSADNARQANSLMDEAKQVVGTANESMGQLTVSMAEISRASEETSKIVKTIDEIAFQTNLLALNAAVEAARAGEAGAGFAVVADEVRNLAMRAAEAAKNTSLLIEGTVKRVKDGSELVGRTNAAFSQVAESSAKVADLVAEIASASGEQSQGIGQINTAVGEMDKITQQNAASAEESASASEELSAQAEHMQGVVAELAALVGGARSSHTASSRPKPAPREWATAPKGVLAGLKKEKPHDPPAKRSAKKPVERMSPLEEDQLADF
jgi:methyl-accepting chemotaxis protein